MVSSNTTASGSVRGASGSLRSACCRTRGSASGRIVGSLTVCVAVDACSGTVFARLFSGTTDLTKFNNALREGVKERSGVSCESSTCNRFLPRNVSGCRVTSAFSFTGESCILGCDSGCTCWVVGRGLASAKL